MLKKIVAVFCLILITLQVSYGAFNMINSSARALGMGNAFVAVADDITCLLDNPAGLSNLKSWESTFTATKIAWGFDNMGEGFAAVGVPLKGLGAAAIGYYNFSHPLYSENVIYFAYSTPVSILTKSSIGVSGKYLSKSFTANDWTAINTDFTSLSKSSISFGLSIHTYVSSSMSLGLFFDDINSPDVGAFSSEILPATARLGLNYSMDRNTKVSLEGYSRGRDLRILFGGENDSIKTGNIGSILIRAGGGVGMNGYFNATAGLGYRFNIPYMGVGGQFDYGFQFPFGFVSGAAGNHMVSLTLRERYKEFVSLGGSKEDERAQIATTQEAAPISVTKENVAAEIIVDKTKYNYEVSEVVRNAFTKTAKFTVLEKSKIEEILKQRKFQYLGCSDTPCAIEIGRAVKSDYVVIGSVSIIEKQQLVNIRILEVESSKIMAGDMEKCALTGDLAAAVQKLVDRASDMNAFKTKVKTIVVLDLEQK